MTSTQAPAGDALSDEGRLWNSSVGQDCAFLLARANAISLKRAHTALREFELKPREYSILAIASDDVRPTQRELAEFLHLDPSQIVSLVDQLERRGLITREPDARDRRAKVILATAAGVELTSNARITVQRAEQAWLDTIPAEGAAQLRAALRALAGAHTQSA